ncbi:hypothetical protein D9M68_740770 [compost metagenome]
MSISAPGSVTVWGVNFTRSMPARASSICSSGRPDKYARPVATQNMGNRFPTGMCTTAR